MTTRKPPPADDDELLKPEEAARKLRISVRSLRKLVADAEIPAVHPYRNSRLVRLRASDIQAHIRGCTEVG